MAQEVMDQMDIRIFLQGDYEELKARREKRQGYVTESTQFYHILATNPIISGPNPFVLAGYVWQDPPGYWDNVVWPAYYETHQHLFSNHDVEHGDPVATDDLPRFDKYSFGPPVPRLIALKTQGQTITELIESACTIISTSSIVNR
jgi:nicotinamide/nicotinate riboside kinase